MPDRHPGTKHLLDLLAPNPNLPTTLLHVSQTCYDLAVHLVDHDLDDGPELTTGLRKLLEAKDCFVRQALSDARTS